jgi:cobalt-zinc-cadmium efflux system outer membrane protein
MIRRFSWFPVLVSALASATPTPAEAQELTLDRALAVMRREHPLLRAAEAELDAADADAVDAGLWTNPVLDASYNPGVVQSSYDPAGYFAWGITQFFEVADTPGARARVARLREDATRSDRDALARELEIEVEAGFVRACDAEARRALWQMRLEQLRTDDSIVEARVDAGAAPRYDLERFSIVLRSAEAALARADAELAAVRGELRATIGPGARTLAGPPVCDGLDAPPLPTREALEGALVERPDLVAARARAAAADAETFVASRSVMPGFALRLGANFGAAPGQVDLYAGVALPLPLLDHGQGAIRAAEGRAASAHGQLEAREIAAAERLAALHAAAMIARESEERASASLASSASMLDEARAGYQSGQFSVLELADAFDAWGEIHVVALETRRTARDAELAVARELGRSLRETPAPAGAR